MDIGAWAALLTFILILSEYLDNNINQNIKNKIALALTNFPNMRLSSLMRCVNLRFIQLFDYIYSINSDKFSGFWYWMFFGFVITISVSLIFSMTKLNISLEKVLTFSLTYVVFVYVVYLLANFVLPKIKSFKLNIINKILFHILLLLSTYLISKYIISTILRLLDIEDFHSDLLYLIIFFILMVTYIFEGIDKSYLFKINPYFAVLSSFIAVAISTMFITFFFKIDLLWFLTVDFKWYLIIYFLLNIFADSFSLWETSIILRFATTKSMDKLPALLLLDLILSAFIFLVIPFSSGNGGLFIEAIFSPRDNPWLAVLFISTFFTSIIFYFFILTIGFLLILQKTLKKYSKFKVILPIEKKPIFCLGMASMIPVTIICLVLL